MWLSTEQDPPHSGLSFVVFLFFFFPKNARSPSFQEVICKEMKTTQSFQVPQSPSIYARDPVLPFQVPSAIHEAPEHSIPGLLQS